MATGQPVGTFVLIHGSGDVGWYWHLVERELRKAGHETVAPDLPCDDDAAGLSEYTDTVVDAIGDRRNLVANTGMEQAVREQARRDGGKTGSDDPFVAFYHDVPRALAEEALSKERYQSATPGLSPWPLAAWPAVPTRFVLCEEDRFFPPSFMRRVAAERLGITPDPIAAGHCVALSRPKELAEMLVRFWRAAAD